MNNISYFQMNGSDWKFKEVIKLIIQTVAYDPLKASSCIKLPDKMANKKAVITMQNSDNECFKWWIARGAADNEASEPTTNRPRLK